MAANPVAVTCLKDQWTIVATAVTIGTIEIVKDSPTIYSYTYVLTGQAAPTDLDEAVSMRFPGKPISNSVAIDVYVYAQVEAGEVVVSL